MRKPESAPRYETLAIGEITPDPSNARTHNQRNLDAIAGSLQAFGQQKPIVVDARGICLAGNGTLAAAKALGWEAIEVIRSELSPAEAIAYGIADNRSAELADWDLDVLPRLLEGLSDEMRQVVDFPEEALTVLGAVDPDVLDVPDSEEVDVESFEGKHQCPRCGFEFDG